MINSSSMHAAAAALALLAASCTVHADELQTVRAEFQRAHAQVNTLSDAGDSEALKNYALYPYLQAARLRQGLSRPAVTADIDQRVKQFLASHDSEPAGIALRRSWLGSLATRKQWREFIEQYREPLANDELRCHSFTARIETQRTEQLAQDIARQFILPRRVPACAQAFDWLRDRQALTHDLIEQRARAALENNNPAMARQVARPLPENRRTPIEQWAALLENPRQQIDAYIGSPQRAVDNAALLAGWRRLARADREGAMARLDRLATARGMSQADASPFAVALALGLSWDRRAEALDYFRRALPADMDDDTLEWQARAALWNGDWAMAKQAIATMSDERREHARWRYWAGRIAEQGGDQALARQLYESVLPNDNFYSIMAGARLKRAVTPHPRQLVLDQTRQKEIESQPAMIRARELLLARMHGPAHLEWRHGLQQLPDADREQAIHLAARWGWYNQAIATATGERVFYDYELLYPRPYDTEVRAGAQLTSLPGALIYAVMRQESLFRPDAVSSANARGLMQMLPETARRTASQWKRPTPSLNDLFNPAINVPLGAATLSSLVQRFNGQVMLALAGYNAGPGAAQRWLPPQPMAPDIWVENIPYNETRNYVQRILWHQLVFNWLESGKAQPVEQWLAEITPTSRTANR